MSPAQDPPKSLDAANLLIEKGAYSEAIALLKRELSEGDVGLRERLGMSHVLDFLLLYSDDIGGAIDSARVSIRLALEGGLPTEADSFRMEVALLEAFRKGLAFRASRDIPSSNAQFDQADHFSAVLKSRPFQLKVADAWSVNYLDSRDDPGRYLALSLRALDLATSLQFRVEVSRAAKKVGTYYALRNEYSRALSYYLKSLSALDMSRNTKDIAKCLNNIAGIYISLGDYGKAKGYLQEAVSRLPSGSSGALRASLFVNLGDLFSGLARRFQSEKYLQSALDCYSSYLGLKEEQGGGSFRLEALAGTAEAYLDQGRLNEARQILSSALQEARKSSNSSIALGKILSLLGEWSLQTEEIPGATGYFREAGNIGERIGSPLLAFSAAFGVGRCAEASGEIEQAIRSYERALGIVQSGFSDITDDIDRAEFIGRGRGPFQALMRLHLVRAENAESIAYARELFRLAESMRGSSFSEFQAKLAGTPHLSNRVLESPERVRLNSERIQLLKELSQADIGPGERERKEVRIIQIDDILDSTIFDQLGGRESPALTRSSRPFQARSLDDRTALLEYVLGDAKSALFCITRDSFHLIELPSAHEIEDDLAGFLSFIEDPSLSLAKGLPAAQRLYRILLSGAGGYLPSGIDRLVIVPDGILFRLPFEALVMSVSGERKPLFVNDRFIVSYSASASSLDLESPRPVTKYPKAALVIGAPRSLPKDNKTGLAPFSPGAILNDIYGRRGFVLDPLPYVGEEVNDLESRFQPGDIDLFRGPGATESTVKSLDLRAYQLIHFACHAFSDDSFPLRSALVLSPEANEREDGYLETSEIYGLRTNADLIVLSACQTGRGKVIMNEGNLGLPRAFFFAGARSVLSTLWPVNDKPSSRFMKNFYDAYYRGEGKAAALRTAKKEMQSSRFSHPYYWAGYVLTGEF